MQNVGELRVAIRSSTDFARLEQLQVVKVNVGALLFVHHAGDVDDARTAWLLGASDEQGEQERCEQEVAQVVDAKYRLKAILGCRQLAHKAGAQASVVQQHCDGDAVLDDALSKGMSAGHGSQVDHSKRYHCILDFLLQACHLQAKAGQQHTV